MPLYLTRIEGPPPKRNVVSSSLAGGAKSTAASPFFGGLQRFLFLFLPVVGSDPPGDFYALHDVCLLIGLERFSQIR